MSWKPSTIAVLPEEFAGIVAGHTVVVFHFWASWNHHDKTMDRVLGEVAREYKARVFIGSIDIDDPNYFETARALKVLNIPALVSFVNGKHFETVNGLPSKEHLERLLQKWLDAAG